MYDKCQKYCHIAFKKNFSTPRVHILYTSCSICKPWRTDSTYARALEIAGAHFNSQRAFLAAALYSSSRNAERRGKKDIKKACIHIRLKNNSKAQRARVGKLLLARLRERGDAHHSSQVHSLTHKYLGRRKLEISQRGGSMCVLHD
jgi:hypothetical protein